MPYLKLYFESSPTLQLSKTFFISPNNQKYISVRGKSSGAYLGAGSFIWSAAVKAIAIFFLKSLYYQKNFSFFHTIPPVMRGEKGTPSHSLALSIIKEPRWMGEMFGCDYDGKCNLKRLIKISNLYFNFGSYVSLGLNLNTLGYDKIEIYLDDVLIIDQEKFKFMILSLGGVIDEEIETLQGSNIEDYLIDSFVTKTKS